MKKFIIGAIALALVSCMSLFADEAQTETKKGKGGYYHESSKSYSDEPEKELTPENSVLVFYTTSGIMTRFAYTQLNPTKIPVVFKVQAKGSHGVVAMPLVEPGSFLKTIGGTQVMGKTQYSYNASLNRYYKYDIQVPNKPGLYYAGNIAEPLNADFSSFEKFMESTNGKGGFGIKTEEKYNNAMIAFEEAALKALLKEYKGTEWEPVINARMEELSK